MMQWVYVLILLTWFLTSHGSGFWKRQKFENKVDDNCNTWINSDAKCLSLSHAALSYSARVRARANKREKDILEKVNLVHIQASKG